MSKLKFKVIKEAQIVLASAYLGLSSILLNVSGWAGFQGTIFKQLNKIYANSITGYQRSA